MDLLGFLSSISFWFRALFMLGAGVGGRPIYMQ